MTLDQISCWLLDQVAKEFSLEDAGQSCALWACSYGSGRIVLSSECFYAPCRCMFCGSKKCDGLASRAVFTCLRGSVWRTSPSMEGSCCDSVVVWWLGIGGDWIREKIGREKICIGNGKEKNVIMWSLSLRNQSSDQSESVRWVTGVCVMGSVFLVHIFISNKDIFIN